MATTTVAAPEPPLRSRRIAPDPAGDDLRGEKPGPNGPIERSDLAKFCQGVYVSPTMSTMNISLPDTLKSFVDEQVSARGYGTSSEYVRELIRMDRER